VIIVVIPCYEGAGSIADVVRGARASGLPVVVVDDGSSDGSGAAAEAAGATVLRHPANRGKGAAVASGFAYAKKLGAAAVLTMDADGQHDPGEIGALVAAHQRAPGALVVGVRSFAPADMPRRSRIGNRISTWWISRFAGRRYQDTQSGFRVYPAALFDVPLISTKFDTETELLLRAAKMSLPLVEVPIRTIYGPGRVTHFHGFRDTLRVIKLVLGSPLWVLLLLVLAAGCAHAPVDRKTAVHETGAVMPVSESWHTMRAEHQVSIEAQTPSGMVKRKLRGLIAVERPDRFRLRALGPAGITLFDIIDVGGQVKVVQAIKDPKASSLGQILESMAADLSAAYDLEPRPPGRTIEHRGEVVVVTEPGRLIEETPQRIDIDNTAHHYKVHVDVGKVANDVALDPALWAQ
jgi:hypothetical protein